MRRVILFLLGWGAKAIDWALMGAVDLLSRLSIFLREFSLVPAPLLRRGFNLSRTLGAGNAGVRKTIPTAPLDLPRDLAAHDWTKNEWWYYTGHLAAGDGRRFGFEVTFFTYRLTPDDGHLLARRVPVTAVMAHFAVVDENAGTHRSGIVMGPEAAIADVSRDRYSLRFATWKASGDERDHRVFAETLAMKLRLELTATKPPVLHGERGIVLKDAGVANYYLSITRMGARGTLTLAGEDIPVEGEAWFDREFGYMGEAAVRGWDWFSIQLDDDTEIMIYAIKDENGRELPQSRACRIDAAGTVEYVPYPEIALEPLGKWKSPRTGAAYPSGWRISIPHWNTDLTVVPTVAGQEFTKGPLPYWEGSCRVMGSHTGRAFIELVGYARGWGQKWLRLLAETRGAERRTPTGPAPKAGG